MYCSKYSSYSQMFFHLGPDHPDRVYMAIKCGSLAYLCGSSTSERCYHVSSDSPDVLILLHQRCSEGLYGSGFYFHDLRLNKRLRHRLFTGMMNMTPLDLD